MIYDPLLKLLFHALIDFKYVLHVHSTSTIANAISLNSEIRLKEIIKEDFNIFHACLTQVFH